MKELTLNRLKEIVDEEIKKGNGECVVKEYVDNKYEECSGMEYSKEADGYVVY